MAIPAGYDIAINGVGYLRPKGEEGRISRHDKQPSAHRSAIGQNSYDYFPDDTFVGIADYAGGVGQARLVAGDQGLVGLGDGRSGIFFPARKLLGTHDANLVGHYFVVDEILYVLNATTGEIYRQSDGVLVGDHEVGDHTCTPAGYPVVSGNNITFYVAEDGDLYRWRGVGHDIEVLAKEPQGLDYIDLVARYGRHILTIGRRTKHTDPTLVTHTILESDDPATDVPEGALSLGPVTPVKKGSTLVAIIICRSSASDTAASKAINYVNKPDSTGWERRRHAGPLSLSTAGGMSYSLWVKENCDYDEVTPTFRPEGADDAGLADRVFVFGALYELQDVRDPSYDKGWTAYETAAGTIINSGNSGQFKYERNALLGLLTVGSSITDLDNPSGWTELYKDNHDLTGVYDLSVTIGYKQVSVRDSERYEDNSITSTVGRIGSIIGFSLNPNLFDLEQVIISYTTDDGELWEEAMTNFGTGFGQPIAARAALGFLWISTNNGLYRLSQNEMVLNDGTSLLTYGLVGPMDDWQLPEDETLTANRIVVKDHILYYNVGSTVRRIAPNADASQLWPDPGWAAPIGGVRGLLGGEGGVYFGAEGCGCGAKTVLHIYDGRAFHTVAEVPNVEDLDYLMLHRGKLYISGGRYYDFTYPSSRPDVYNTDGSIFETGAYITSELDFEKVDLTKILSYFQSQIHWVGSGSTRGTVTVQYINASTDNPGRYGGKADPVSWQTLYTHTYADGGVKSHTLTTGELSGKSWYFRILLAPGTTGYPALKAGPVIAGETRMPAVKQITVPISAYVGQHHGGNEMAYKTRAEVAAVLDNLIQLRESDTAFTLEYEDLDGTAASYRVTCAMLEDWVEIKGTRGDSAVLKIMATFNELPNHD